MSTDTRSLLPRRRTLRFFVSVVGFVLFWQLFAYLFPLGVATPYATLQYVVVLVTGEGRMLIDTLAISLFRIVSGFLLALLAGTSVGVVMGMFEAGEDYLYVLVLIGMMIPSLSWAMIALVIFGLNEVAIVTAITITTTPFVTVSIWEGVKDADTELLEVARVFKFTRAMTIRHVVLPQIMPYIFSAARYGFGLAWKIAVVVELLGASSGVGYQLNQAFNFASLEGVFGWTMIIVLVMVLIEYGIIRSIERSILSWREPSSAAQGGRQW